MRCVKQSEKLPAYVRNQMMAKRLSMACLLVGLLSVTAHGQLQIKKDLEDNAVGDRWSYNDWDSAKAAAAKSKKPILALFRCVP